MLSKNKITTYLLYAIGEILLVVVGILIAVSIDNWNSDRKAGIAEVKLLETMLKDLRTDSVAFSRSRNSRISTQQLHSQLFLESRDPSQIKDSMNVDLIRKGAMRGITFLRNQADNIQLVRNDSLRADLKWFILHLEVAENAALQYQEYLDERLKPYFASHGIHELEGMFNSDGSATPNTVGYVNYQKLQEQYGTVAFKEHLFELSVKNSWLLTRMDYVIGLSQDIKAKIEAELENRK